MQTTGGLWGLLNILPRFMETNQAQPHRWEESIGEGEGFLSSHEQCYTGVLCGCALLNNKHDANSPSSSHLHSAPIITRGGRKN